MVKYTFFFYFVLLLYISSISGFHVKHSQKSLHSHKINREGSSLIALENLFLRPTEKTQTSKLRRKDSSTSSLLAVSSSDGDDAPSFDFDAITKYAIALVTQLSLLYGFFTFLDTSVTGAELHASFWMNFILFYLLSLRSRVFNPLKNTRPNMNSLELDGGYTTKWPSWTPPGVVFPIMWILIIGPLRAASTAMIYDATQSYAHPAILAFALHLSIGDIWNTINNVEKRRGFAVTAASFVVLSKANVAYQYYLICTDAGQLMTIPLAWLVVAWALVADTWRLNVDQNTGKVEPLLPVIGQSSTEFAWFSKK